MKKHEKKNKKHITLILYKYANIQLKYYLFRIIFIFDFDVGLLNFGT